MGKSSWPLVFLINNFILQDPELLLLGTERPQIPLT